jgi:haloalkane dehalogenase
VAWHAAATDPARLGGDMPVGSIVAGALTRPGHDREAVRGAYDAPFPDIRYKAGPRRFPACLPFADPIAGNAADQQRCYDSLRHWTKPANLIFGDADDIFTFDWATEWAATFPSATLDLVSGAGHFVVEDAPADVTRLVRQRLLPA